MRRLRFRVLVTGCSREGGAEVTAQQLRELVQRLIRAGELGDGDSDVLVVVDAGYAVPLLAFLLRDRPYGFADRTRGAGQCSPVKAALQDDSETEMTTAFARSSQLGSAGTDGVHEVGTGVHGDLLAVLTIAQH
ncbi:hypothetical protein GCM10010430_73950 [Kitasatospora cystarginea]|uniref:Transposase IS701-like DDE domain-containing protein n=1 Tax=Kitasatospora cystarginea TaxID=58350 RepID=A0ABN3EZ17_9ACTN